MFSRLPDNHKSYFCRDSWQLDQSAVLSCCSDRYKLRRFFLLWASVTDTSKHKRPAPPPLSIAQQQLRFHSSACTISTPVARGQILVARAPPL